MAWFKDYNNGGYHLLRVTVTSQSQQHTLSVFPFEEEGRLSEYPTALTFILDARGEFSIGVVASKIGLVQIARRVFCSQFFSL